LILNGCGGGGSGAVSSQPHAAPTGAGGCNDLPQVNLDPGVVSGFDWSGEKHAFPDVVTIFACVDPKGGGELTLEALPTGVSVTPTVQPITPAGNGVLPFRIRVQSGAAGTFHLLRRIDGETIGPQSQGPTIVSDASGWHFVSSH
jgi:hypothetical protein